MSNELVSLLYFEANIKGVVPSMLIALTSARLYNNNLTISSEMVLLLYSAASIKGVNLFIFRVSIGSSYNNLLTLFISPTLAASIKFIILLK